MRNNISGSHPNVGEINSFELLGWLQTCVNEVLSDNPSEGAIKVQQFIKNLKLKDSQFSTSEISSIENSLKHLSSKLSGNILKTIFSMYTDLKINIKNKTKFIFSIKTTLFLF